MLLPAISAPIRARIIKLGKRKGTSVNYMVCNFGDLESIHQGQTRSTLKNMTIFGEMTYLHLLRSCARTILTRIKPKQRFDSWGIPRQINHP